LTKHSFCLTAWCRNTLGEVRNVYLFAKYIAFRRRHPFPYFKDSNRQSTTSPKRTRLIRKAYPIMTENSFQLIKTPALMTRLAVGIRGKSHRVEIWIRRESGVWRKTPKHQILKARSSDGPIRSLSRHENLCFWPKV
jgi:hypothetical protein